MPERIGRTDPPSGARRLFFRFPIWLYRLGLGWLLGKRFLLLNHVGRKSGLIRQAVLEVAHYDDATDTYTVASGFGTRSNWYRNLLACPEVTIRVGRRELPVRATPLSADDSGRAMVRYAKQYPSAAKNIARLCGFRVDGSDEDYFALGRDVIPFIALAPRIPQTPISRS